jgi:hypothetical protein
LISSNLSGENHRFGQTGRDPNEGTMQAVSYNDRVRYFMMWFMLRPIFRHGSGRGYKTRFSIAADLQIALMNSKVHLDEGYVASFKKMPFNKLFTMSSVLPNFGKELKNVENTGILRIGDSKISIIGNKEEIEEIIIISLLEEMKERRKFDV